MPAEVRYIHAVKVSGERDRYDLDFHTQHGIEPLGRLTGAGLDRLRFCERRLRGKRLTVAGWRDLLKKESVACVPTVEKSSMNSAKSAAKSRTSRPAKKVSKRK